MKSKSRSTTSKRTKLAPVHPGEVLLEDFMKPRDLSATRLAMDLHIPASRVTAIIRGERALTADTALRLARYFDVSAQFWMNIQASYDLAVAQDASEQQINREVHSLAHA
jgi:addiction module HigA family antidote